MSGCGGTRPEGPERIEPRGIHNPAVVDLIRFDAATNEVVLCMLQRRPWAASIDPAAELEEKCNAYFGYVLQGYLLRDYPQYQDVPVRLRCEWDEPPPEEVRRVLTEAAAIANRHNLRWEDCQLSPESRRTAEWESDPPR